MLKYWPRVSLRAAAPLFHRVLLVALPPNYNLPTEQNTLFLGFLHSIVQKFAGKGDLKDALGQMGPHFSH